MRTMILVPPLVAALALLGAASAQAGVLESATWNGDFLGTPYTLETGNGLQASGVSSPASAAVNLTVTQTNTGVPCPIDQGAATGTCFAPNLNQIDPEQLIPLFIQQTLGGSQGIAIAGRGALIGVDQGIPGEVDVDLAGIGDLFAVPLSVGASFSQVIQTAALGVIPVTVTVEVAGWQTGATTIPQTDGGSPVPSFTAAGTFDLRAPSGAGTVKLIAPSVLSITILGSPDSTSASATELVLDFGDSLPSARGGLALGETLGN